MYNDDLYGVNFTMLIGMSLLIMISIISSFPAQGSLIHAENGIVALVVVLAVLIAIIAVVVFVEQGQRRIVLCFAAVTSVIQTVADDQRV